MFFSLGVAQALHHLYKDYDRVAFDVVKGTNPEEQQRPQTVTAALLQIRQKFLPLLLPIPPRIIIVTVIASSFYLTVLRHTAWKWTFMFAKNIYKLPKASRPATGATDIVDLLGRFAVEAVLLSLLWEFANLAFDVFVSQPPLKKGMPLSQGSVDPNSTLLAGLRAKKEVTRVRLYFIRCVLHCLISSRTSLSGNSSLSPQHHHPDARSFSKTLIGLVAPHGRRY